MRRANTKAMKCSICKENPALGTCGICKARVCKVCDQYVRADSFDFAEKTPLEFTQGHYCAPCYGEKLEPALANYAEILEKARKVFIFHADNPLPRSLIKKSNKGISVPQCLDKDETYLRLGFRAVEKGFNAVVEVKVERSTPRKFWSGQGTPAHVNEKQQSRYEN